MACNRANSGVAERFARGSAFVLIAMVTGALSLSACSVVKAVSKVAHTVEGNKNTIDAFSTKVKSGEAVPFQATYVTTGTSPATIVYSVKPPNGLLFKDSPSGSSGSNGVNGFEVVVNPSGEFACTPLSGSTKTWTCQKLDPANATTEHQIF